MILFGSGLFRCIFNTGHFLKSLLRLEFLALGIFLILAIRLVKFSSGFFFLLYYLVLMISEGVLGLALLVAMAHSYGKDYIKIINVLLC